MNEDQIVSDYKNFYGITLLSKKYKISGKEVKEILKSHNVQLRHVRVSHAKVKEMFESGMSRKAIAHHLGCSYSCVCTILVHRNYNEVQAYCAKNASEIRADFNGGMSHDDVCEKYFITRAALSVVMNHPAELSSPYAAGLFMNEVVADE